jgi:hypothetical protein
VCGAGGAEHTRTNAEQRRRERGRNSHTHTNQCELARSLLITRWRPRPIDSRRAGEGIPYRAAPLALLTKLPPPSPAPPSPDGLPVRVCVVRTRALEITMDDEVAAAACEIKKGARGERHCAPLCTRPAHNRRRGGGGGGGGSASVRPEPNHVRCACAQINALARASTQGGAARSPARM